MRITQNQIAQMLSNQVSHLDGKQAQVGSLIKGEILKLQGQMITLSQNGKTMTLENQSQTPFSVGDMAVFEVLKSDSEGILVKPALVPSEQATPSVNAQQLLNTLGLTDTQDNLQVAKALLKFDLPLTPAVFNQVKAQVAGLKVLRDEMQHTGYIPNQLLNKEVPLKSLVLQLMQTSQAGDNSSASKLMTAQDANAQLGALSQSGSQPAHQAPQADQNQLLVPFSKADVLMANEPVVSRLENKQAAIQNLLASLGGDGQDAALTGQKAPIKAESLQALFQVLTDFDADKSALMMKRGLDFNISHVLMLALEEEGQTLNQSVRDLSQKLLGLKPELLKDVFQMIMNDQTSPEEKLDVLTKLLSSVQTGHEEGKAVQTSANLMKEMVQVVKSDNPQFYMMEVPIKQDDYETSVKLYYNKKETSNESADHMTLLIALKTHTLDEVRCVIQKKDQHFDLSFRLKDKKIVKLFKGNEGLLQDKLAKLSKGTFICHFILDDQTPSEAIISDPMTYGFDLKV